MDISRCCNCCVASGDVRRIVLLHCDFTVEVKTMIYKHLMHLMYAYLVRHNNIT